MRLYESVIIARQDVSTTQVEAMIEEFSAIIEKAGGSIQKKRILGPSWSCLPDQEKPEGSLCHAEYGN